jgi:hypothetical protein
MVDRSYRAHLAVCENRCLCKIALHGAMLRIHEPQSGKPGSVAVRRMRCENNLGAGACTVMRKITSSTASARECFLSASLHELRPKAPGVVCVGAL